MANLDGLDPALQSIVQRIIAESGGRVTISSGFRTRAEQEALYAKYRSGQGNLAAKPGTSMHEHGGAVDFGGDLGLAAQLARKYGLVNSVDGEPWHFTLGGEEGSHTNTHSEYDLGENTASNPQDVLANRIHSVLNIIGKSTADTGSPESDDPAMDQEFAVGQDSNTVSQSGPKSTLQKYAAEKAKALGWDDADIASLVQLWNRESGWDPKAQNPSSTAYGIAQFLDGTWKGVGVSKTDDPYQQIDAGLSYIQGKYGDPTRALSFHDQNNYY